jgi:hypothetical protein
MLQIITGELTDEDALSSAIASQDAIISILGPNSLKIQRFTFTDAYRRIFRLMEAHGVSRILAMGTISIYEPEDGFSMVRSLLVWLVWAVAHRAWEDIVSIGRLFDEEATRDGLAWTIYRVGNLSNGKPGPVATGKVGDAGWSSWINRSEIAEWLVEQAEMETPQWVGMKPAISSSTLKKES